MMAYAAAVYIRAEDAHGNVVVTLAMAKACPAPMKWRSIPLLELQGAVLASRLGNSVSAALGVGTEEVTYWTDSMNVIYWVRSLSRRFTVAVGNRVLKFNSILDSLSGIMFPARTILWTFPHEELPHSSWWMRTLSGLGQLAFLSQEPSVWPRREIVVPSTLPCLLKKKQGAISLHTAILQPDSMRLHPDNYSSWTRLVRITALCRRFVARLKSGGKKK